MSCTNSAAQLWALVDCNNFYVSCERLFRPDLLGRPVVVLSNNDGCIVSRSNEAKALGIGMAEPVFKVRPLLRQHNVAVFSSNYALYGDISQRVMATLESLVPAVEQYSIDEAFIPLHGALAVQADELAYAIRERVRKWTGIVVSVGIGSTKTLAKLANDKAKKGTGILRLDAKSCETRALLQATPVGDVWGIGFRLADKLQRWGILTASHLCDAEDAVIQKLLTVSGLRTAMELRGVNCIEQHESPVPRRTMVSSRSFGQQVKEKSYLAEALALHATRAGERLRREQLEASGIAIHIRTARHAGDLYYSKGTEILFTQPTNLTDDFIHAAHRGLEAIFRPGYAYAKAGVMLFGLVAPGGRQLGLFEADKKQSRQQLMKALDAVNARYGRGTLHYGAEGNINAPWHMQQSYRSLRHTTSWSELKVVK